MRVVVKRSQNNELIGKKGIVLNITGRHYEVQMDHEDYSTSFWVEKDCVEILEEQKPKQQLKLWKK